ncbi:VPLPA-CTERM protein sorting domain-containing protein [Albimonas donghaensis]|uniref:VPLPA-CTERM protein sorting domain-containing protein n=2 Tax=Albimonas donghaensis TaxID=356660 RepID=A0A1H3F319_9RHOB|nr:VPLPA-CTERM protein sorting domain-containing protein [Albimonas donghaensis]
MELTLTDSAGEDVSDPFGRLRILPDGADRAGTVGETTGEVLVRRADGTTFTPRPGDAIGLGDRIETMDDGTLRLDLDDGSEFDVPADTSLDIDAFVYDPDSDDTPYELNRPVMEFMRTLHRIPREPEPDFDDDTSKSSLGIRGDAEEELRRHLLENPEDVLGYVGIYMETASPVGVSTLVAASDDIAVLSFDYSFLSGAGFLSVELGGTEIFFDIAGDAGEMRSASLSLDIGDPGRLSELLIRVDGEAGLGFSLWNVMFDGTPLDDLDAFARLGAGPVTAALIASSEEYDRMLAGAGVVPTPVPAAGLLLAGALGAMAHVGRRRRTRAWTRVGA